MSDAMTMQRLLDDHLSEYHQRHPLSSRQRQVCSHIQRCRTAQLGGLQLQCDHCHDAQIHYYACRDRHCPGCQRQASEQWSDRQQADLLPVTYHHLVFTLPHELNRWVAGHPQLLYGLLFEAVWATLKAFGLKRLHGRIGMVAVLHTWGQTLNRHVHLHCLVPGGALSDAGEWQQPNGSYLFPVRALSRHYRGHYVSRLRERIEAGGLPVTAETAKAMLDRLMGHEWAVYSKPCLQRTETVVEYLARYTHRIALSDYRLGPMDAQGRVALRYKDYRDHNRHKTLLLEPKELIRRYLLHLLPRGFMRIRHFGILANCCRQHCLRQIRQALAVLKKEITRLPAEAAFSGYPCTQCGKGVLRIVAEVEPIRYSGG